MQKYVFDIKLFLCNLVPANIVKKVHRRVAQVCTHTERDITRRSSSYLIEILKDLAEVYRVDNYRLVESMISDALAHAPNSRFRDACESFARIQFAPSTYSTKTQFRPRQPPPMSRGFNCLLYLCVFFKFTFPFFVFFLFFILNYGFS